FLFQAEDGIRDLIVTGVQTCALPILGGGCATCMIDNAHLVVLQGTGRAMVPVPEMQAFGERYHFVFKAHEKGDANRSAHVERRRSEERRVGKECRYRGSGYDERETC